MKDLALHLDLAFPPVGQSLQTGTLDLNIDNAGATTAAGAMNFSDNWRQGRLRVSVPALPNNTNNAVNITITMQDSTDGVTFANTNPQVTVNIPGVATNGSAATVIDVPVPPDCRGPIQFTVTVAANAGGDCTGQLGAIDWVNE